MNQELSFVKLFNRVKRLEPRNDVISEEDDRIKRLAVDLYFAETVGDIDFNSFEIDDLLEVRDILPDIKDHLDFIDNILRKIEQFTPISVNDIF